MIAWGIIWGCGFLIEILLILMEIINGSISIRFWVCIFLLLILIFISIFTIGAYRQSCIFVYQYADFAEKVKTMSDDQEYHYLGNAINYNRILAIYQHRIKCLGIFAPYSKEIRKLEPIKLRNFNMDNYAWWDFD